MIVTNKYLENDGFICTTEHALEVAQMISNIESIYDEDYREGHEALFLLEDYLRNKKTTQEVNEILYREWSEFFPGLKKDVD